LGEWLKEERADFSRGWNEVLWSSPSRRSRCDQVGVTVHRGPDEFPVWGDRPSSIRLSNKTTRVMYVWWKGTFISPSGFRGAADNLKRVLLVVYQRNLPKYNDLMRDYGAGSLEVTSLHELIKTKRSKMMKRHVDSVGLRAGILYVRSMK
jgi:hypothetical protein